MWIFYALSAAVLWGASYTLYGVLLKHVSSVTTSVLSALGGIVIYTIFSLVQGSFTKDFNTLKSDSTLIQMTLGVMVVNALACLLVQASIKASNATLAGLVEITYPLFTALFTWVLLRENTMTPGTIAGAVLIFLGVTCVYYFNKVA